MTEKKKKRRVIKAKKKLDRWCQVKFTDVKGVIHYGEYPEELPSDGEQLYEVADMLFPVRHEVNESQLTVIPRGSWDHKIGGHDDEAGRYIAAAFEQAKKDSDAAGEFGVNSMFAIGVADGQAWYVVTKVNKKTCNVEWRGFGADTYTDHFFGWGREKVPIEDVKHYTRHYSTLVELFGGKE